MPRRLAAISIIGIACASYGLSTSLAQDGGVMLQEVRPLQCNTGPCPDHDAIVFVHGLRGGEDSFKNGNFDWPGNMPMEIDAGGKTTKIDVFRLVYPAALANWAQKTNPNFDDIIEEIIPTLKRIRTKGYRTIGFIAHSLGGIIVASYLHAIKAEFGHPQRSQHGFVITLGTPYNGARLASLAQSLNLASVLNSDLLESLKDNNLYLRMIRRFSEKTAGKGKRYDCRPVPLFVAHEASAATFFNVNFFIVPKESAVDPIERVVDPADIRGFDLSHSEIAAPASTTDEIYKWVDEKIKKAYFAAESWPTRRIERNIPNVNHQNYLCSLISFIREE